LHAVIFQLHQSGGYSLVDSWELSRSVREMILVKKPTAFLVRMGVDLRRCLCSKTNHDTEWDIV
jgi:hypothetical protein